MDTLFWKQLDPDVQVKESKQLLYGKYAYRLVLTCTGGAMLRYPDTPFDQQLDYRRQVNYGGSWRSSRMAMPTDQQLSMLKSLVPIRAEIIEKNEVDLKMRIEDPYIQFYSTDEKYLKELATRIFVNGHKPSDYLVSITVPFSQEGMDIISQGYVLKDSQHGCKIHIRDGRYNQETRTALIKYLDSVEGAVTVPTNTRKILERPQGDYIWGAYFYSNDDKIPMMIHLIDPRLIRTVERYHSTAK